MFDSAVLLSFPTPCPGKEGEILKAVRGDEIRVPGAVFGFEIRGGLAGAGVDNDNELVIIDLEYEFVVVAEVRAWFEPAFLERVSDVL